MFFNTIMHTSIGTSWRAGKNTKTRAMISWCAFCLLVKHEFYFVFLCFTLGTICSYMNIFSHVLCIVWYIVRDEDDWMDAFIVVIFFMHIYIGSFIRCWIISHLKAKIVYANYSSNKVCEILCHVWDEAY